MFGWVVVAVQLFGVVSAAFVRRGWVEELAMQTCRGSRELFWRAAFGGPQQLVLYWLAGSMCVHAAVVACMTHDLHSCPAALHVLLVM